MREKRGERGEGGTEEEEKVQYRGREKEITWLQRSTESTLHLSSSSTSSTDCSSWRLRRLGGVWNPSPLWNSGDSGRCDGVTPSSSSSGSEEAEGGRESEKVKGGGNLRHFVSDVNISHSTPGSPVSSVGRAWDS